MSKLITFLFAISFSIYSWSTENPFRTDFPCKKNVEQISKDWGSQSDWRNRKTPTQPFQWITPTDQLGSWIILNSKPGMTTLRKVSSNVTLTVELSLPSCQGKAIVPKIENTRNPLNEPSFNDRDFEKVLKENKSGFIYVWSPMMPLSIQGLPHFKEALKGSKHSLTVLVDPNARPYVFKPGWKKEIGLNEARKVASSELFFRDIQNHYPAILFYKNGKIHPAIKYGYERPNQFAKDIKYYETSL